MPRIFASPLVNVYCATVDAMEELYCENCIHGAYRAAVCPPICPVAAVMYQNLAAMDNEWVRRQHEKD
jgi:hypothetical protein